MAAPAATTFCPECREGLTRRVKHNKDARCTSCLSSKDVLPVNYRRASKKREEEDED